MFLGRRILSDDELQPKFKFFHRIAAKEHKTYFANKSDVTEHYRKQLLGYLEYTGIIGQSISAKQAALNAAMDAEASDSDDADFNKITPGIPVASGTGLSDDIDYDSGNNDDDYAEESVDGKYSFIICYFICYC